jgi:hypothetical protein
MDNTCRYAKRSMILSVFYHAINQPQLTNRHSSYTYVYGRMCAPVEAWEVSVGRMYPHPRSLTCSVWLIVRTQPSKQVLSMRVKEGRKGRFDG